MRYKMKKIESPHKEGTFVAIALGAMPMIGGYDENEGVLHQPLAYLEQVREHPNGGLEVKLMLQKIFAARPRVEECSVANVPIFYLNAEVSEDQKIVTAYDRAFTDIRARESGVINPNAPGQGEVPGMQSADKFPSRR